MRKWDMVTKPKYKDGKWSVAIVNAWTNNRIETYEFDKKKKARKFFEKKTKELAFRGMG